MSETTSCVYPARSTISQVERTLPSEVLKVIRMCAVFLPLWLALRTGLAADRPPNELEVKAAFVLNFVRLIRWENIPGGAAAAELSVCAMGNSEFAIAVRQVAAGKLVGTRSIAVTLNPPADISHCRVLIVDAAQYPIAREALHGVRSAHVLTIGNGAGLIPLGGMFELIVEDHTVKFDANLEAIQQSGLEVSARLLQLSRNLRKGTNGNP